MFQWSFRSEIWQVSRQRLKQSKHESRGFETSRDLAVGHPSHWWLEALMQWRVYVSFGLNELMSPWNVEVWKINERNLSTKIVWCMSTKSLNYMSQSYCMHFFNILSMNRLISYTITPFPILFKMLSCNSIMTVFKYECMAYIVPVDSI